MSRRVVGVTLDNLDHLPRTCRRCVFWELAPHIREQAEEFGETEFEKEAWVSNVLLDWGSCGRVLYIDNVPAGYALYAPPAVVPRAAAFPSGPISADAVLLTALRVVGDFEHGGLGRVLVQNVAKDLTRRGVRAIEAFGDLHEDAGGCVIPAGFLQQVGFKTVQQHPKWPRLRLELRTAISWKEDVEAALERLLGTVSVRTAEPALG
ncbi:MAG: GNAT family N-acetyltransferase [Saccharopolyspora sp.]|uniref:GNAT family N-acetyltransferase n=1 Tax=Saccharopolyspora TaxID=1835 RepID=UPI00190DB1C9|nr:MULTISPECIES: GNAT family N-acetyltransferase [unclassified Saccharopolyspora]MBK0865300.1 GNAT family N-acetyltransferase [Saccharopolyspora sp. HNM0986]MBQ6643593.1 GNAT family N-acetyltransferase [Saccharopolyspora sp.]